MTIEYLTLADCRLAYQRQVGSQDKPGVIFLSGFASDMTGAKATFLSKNCTDQGLSYVRFDYRGCGQSSGNFIDGTIGAWFEDALAVFDHLTIGPQIVIGSSMGGWLGLLMAEARPDRVKALIGVAAAPDFTEELIWEKLTKTRREILLREGKIYDDNVPCDHHFPFTLQLIQEARSHLVLRRPLMVNCPIRLLHGMCDLEVPWSHTLRLADHLRQGDVETTLIKDGDHRLSMPKNLSTLWQTLVPFL